MQNISFTNLQAGLRRWLKDHPTAIFGLFTAAVLFFVVITFLTYIVLPDQQNSPLGKNLQLLKGATVNKALRDEAFQAIQERVPAIDKALNEPVSDPFSH